MILKAEVIAQLLREGENPATADPLVFAPSPNVEELEKTGSASLDLRLGTWFSTLRQGRMQSLRIQQESRNRLLTKTHYVPFGGEYVLHPRSFVLGVTLEWMRIPNDVAAYVVGKSSWGRRGLIIATATGVHPGFKGCLTLELSNVGEIPVVIEPGMLICQLFLHKVHCLRSTTADRSRFVGMRRPTLGRLERDDIADRLARSYGGNELNLPNLASENEARESQSPPGNAPTPSVGASDGEGVRTN